MKKFHNDPYSEETLTKLGIFRDYLRSWLPVFINKGKIYWQNIIIADFFAGQGCDVNGTPGSALIIFEELKPYSKMINEKKIKVNVVLNEKSKSVFNALEKNINIYQNNLFYKIITENESFNDVFSKYYSSFNRSDTASLAFLDQFGIKEIDRSTFRSLINLKRTDFLFFISSSIIKRFFNEKSINRKLEISKSQINQESYNYIHKIVYNHYKDQVNSKDYFLAPFSIKKGANIYGLIFGSNHPLGMEKFLNVAWKYDKVRGEANFDITNEHIIEDQLDLFTGQKKMANKLELFEKEIIEKIDNNLLRTDKDLYLFTINRGIRLMNTRKVLKKLYNEGKIVNWNLKLSHKSFGVNQIENKLK